MLSFAEGPSFAMEPLVGGETEVVEIGVPLVRGAADGMIVSGRR